jgi:hypothetical protein
MKFKKPNRSGKPTLISAQGQWQPSATDGHHPARPGDLDSG